MPPSMLRQLSAKEKGKGVLPLSFSLAVSNRPEDVLFVFRSKPNP